MDSVSAKLGNGRETPLDLDRNHSEICKFSGANDPAYDAVGENIKSMAKRAREHQAVCPHDQRGNCTWYMANFDVILLDEPQARTIFDR